jgi:hypothetical protein
VNPGFLAKERRANRTSCIHVFIGRHRSIGSGQPGERAYRNDGRLNSNSGRQHVLSYDAVHSYSYSGEQVTTVICRPLGQGLSADFLWYKRISRVRWTDDVSSTPHA